MASIYGFKLKKIKTFPGREWEGVVADLWYNGKKIGQYADYGNGADGTIEYCEYRQGKEEHAPILDKAIKKLAEDERFSDFTRETLRKTDYFMGEGVFIEELLQLTSAEKEYKKIVKQGFSCIAYYEHDGKNYATWFKTTNDQKIEKLQCSQSVKQFRIYKSIEDFDIN